MASPDQGWVSLLAQPGGPEGVYDRVLRLICEEVSEPPTGIIESVFAGADESLGAVAVLRGPADCCAFIAAVAPIAQFLGRMLDSLNEMAALGLLALAAESETVGSSLALPKFNVDRKFTDFLVDKYFSPNDRITVALLSLGFDRLDDVRLLFPKAKPDGGEDPITLVSILATALQSPSGRKDVTVAWEAFLRGFPSALKAKKAEWRHLLLAARIVLAKLGDTPPGEVAEALHRRAVALAEEESA